MKDKENVIYDDKIVSFLVGFLWPYSENYPSNILQLQNPITNI